MKAAKDLMTKKVISVNPDTLLVEAINMVFKYNFNGLPVVDNANRLVGILTEYDLVIKGSSIHLPTLIKLFSELDHYKKDKGLIKNDLEKIFKAKVSEAMNADPLTLQETATLEEVVKAFSEHHRVNPIPIMNLDNKMVGIISRSDLIKPFQAPNLDLINQNDQRELDKNINKFLDNFEQRFIFVSKFRTYKWLIASVLFAVVGYMIAWFLILRINF